MYVPYLPTLLSLPGCLVLPYGEYPHPLLPTLYTTEWVASTSWLLAREMHRPALPPVAYRVLTSYTTLPLPSRLCFPALSSRRPPSPSLHDNLTTISLTNVHSNFNANFPNSTTPSSSSSSSSSSQSPPPLPPPSTPAAYCSCIFTPGNCTCDTALTTLAASREPGLLVFLARLSSNTMAASTSRRLNFVRPGRQFELVIVSSHICLPILVQRTPTSKTYPWTDVACPLLLLLDESRRNGKKDDPTSQSFY